MTDHAETKARDVRLLSNTMAFIAKYPNHINGAYHVDRAGLVVLKAPA